MNVDDIKKFFSRISPISWTVNFLLNRANLANDTLKQKYSSVLRIGVLFGCVFMLLGFYSLQRFENDIDIETEGQIII
jgi:protein TonB